MLKLLHTFTKSQIASGVGTLADFATFSFLVNYVRAEPVVAVAISSIVGAVIIFRLARRWAFRARMGRLQRQLSLFVLCAFISILLNASGLHLLLKYDVIEQPTFARVIMAIVIGIIFNFPFQRFVVFNEGIELHQRRKDQALTDTTARNHPENHQNRNQNRNQTNGQSGSNR